MRQALLENRSRLAFVRQTLIVRKSIFQNTVLIVRGDFLVHVLLALIESQREMCRVEVRLHHHHFSRSSFI